MSSTIPACVAALVVRFKLAAGQVDGEDVEVYDGPPMTEGPRSWVTVGFDPGDETSVEFTREWAQLGAQRREERYDVLCSLTVWTGDDTPVDSRTAAFALLDRLEKALSIDLTLGDVVRTAQVLGGGALLLEQDGKGLTAGVRFRVAVTARIT